ncbi:MAG TPA: TetR/AcrR family transcriptional regulator [Solirubrobacteraceae bacterium]|nr:TetR/AcrR family transcriptional regulator [Solirubrobacteraceae bacterium]
MPPADTTAPARPMRADARRNREHLLAAARAAFAEHGIDVQIDDIAQRAGLGVGTLYRHFATKEELFCALAVEHFSALADRAEAARDAPGSPWERLSGLLYDAARQVEGDAAMSQIMAERPELMECAAPEKARLLQAIGAIITAGVAAGELRPDASVDDIPAIMCGVGQVMTTAPWRPGAGWERFLQIALDGLRFGARANR